MRGITLSILVANLAAASLAGSAAAADLRNADPVLPPTPATAAPPRTYIALRGALTAGEDTTIKTSLGRVETRYDSGYLASAGIGVHLDTVLGEASGLRGEIEVGYQTKDVSGHRSPGLASRGSAAGGKVDATYAVASLYYDFLPAARITPFVGAGAGLAQLTFDEFTHGSRGRILDDRTTDWFYHATAGLTVKLTPRWQVEAAYRMTSVPSASPQDATGVRQNMNVTDQLVLVGARAHF